MGGDRAGSIGALITSLIESAKSFARAEIALAKCTARDWFDRAKIALALLAVAAVLALASVTVLLAAFGMALAPWLGIAGGLAVAALIALAIVGILVVLAIKRFSGMRR